MSVAGTGPPWSHGEAPWVPARPPPHPSGRTRPRRPPGRFARPAGARQDDRHAERHHARLPHRRVGAAAPIGRGAGARAGPGRGARGRGGQRAVPLRPRDGRDPGRDRRHARLAGAVHAGPRDRRARRRRGRRRDGAVRGRRRGARLAGLVRRVPGLPPRPRQRVPQRPRRPGLRARRRPRPLRRGPGATGRRPARPARPRRRGPAHRCGGHQPPRGGARGPPAGGRVGRHRRRRGWAGCVRGPASAGADPRPGRRRRHQSRPAGPGARSGGPRGGGGRGRGHRAGRRAGRRRARHRRHRRHHRRRAGRGRPYGAFGLVGAGGGTFAGPWFGGLPRDAEVFIVPGLVDRRRARGGRAGRGGPHHAARSTATRWLGWPTPTRPWRPARSPGGRSSCPEEGT